MSDHRAIAEDLLEHASHVHGENRTQALAEAQVHATLALVDAQHTTVGQAHVTVDGGGYALVSQTEFARRSRP